MGCPACLISPFGLYFSRQQTLRSEGFREILRGDFHSEQIRAFDAGDIYRLNMRAGYDRI